MGVSSIAMYRSVPIHCGGVDGWRQEMLDCCPVSCDVECPAVCSTHYLNSYPRCMRSFCFNLLLDPKALQYSVGGRRGTVGHRCNLGEPPHSVPLSYTTCPQGAPWGDLEAQFNASQRPPTHAPTRTETLSPRQAPSCVRLSER